MSSERYLPRKYRRGPHRSRKRAQTRRVLFILLLVLGLAAAAYFSLRSAGI